MHVGICTQHCFVIYMHNVYAYISMCMYVCTYMSYSRIKLHYCFVLDNMSPEQAIQTAYLILLPDIKRYK